MGKAVLMRRLQGRAKGRAGDRMRFSSRHPGDMNLTHFVTERKEGKVQADGAENETIVPWGAYCHHVYTNRQFGRYQGLTWQSSGEINT